MVSFEAKRFIGYGLQDISRMRVELWGQTKQLNMKSLLFSLFTLGVFFSCESAKETMNLDQVPAAVRQAFAAAHPNTKVEWDAEDDGTYEVEYKVDGEEVSDNYSATGELLETEMEIRKKDLPAAVLIAITEQFPDHEIEEAAHITYPDGRIAYEAELEGDDDAKFDAIFSAEGKLIERTALSAERDDD